MADPKLSASAKKAIERIALERCGFETLEERHSDRLDFKEVSVWGLKAALEAAYMAGAAQAGAPQFDHLAGPCERMQ